MLTSGTNAVGDRVYRVRQRRIGRYRKRRASASKSGLFSSFQPNVKAELVEPLLRDDAQTFGVVDLVGYDAAAGLNVSATPFMQ